MAKCEALSFRSTRLAARPGHSPAAPATSTPSSNVPASHSFGGLPGCRGSVWNAIIHFTMSYRMINVFCGTAGSLEEERQAFYRAAAECNQAEAMAGGAL